MVLDAAILRLACGYVNVVEELDSSPHLEEDEESRNDAQYVVHLRALLLVSPPGLDTGQSDIMQDTYT